MISIMVYIPLSDFVTHYHNMFTYTSERTDGSVLTYYFPIKSSSGIYTTF